jgi:hypothetical protein
MGENRGSTIPNGDMGLTAIDNRHRRARGRQVAGERRADDSEPAMTIEGNGPGTTPRRKPSRLRRDAA